MDGTLALMKAMADGNRLRVVTAMMEHEELCVCQITSLLGIATPTVSRHMSILQAARIVRSRKDGRWVFYGLDASFPEDLRRWLSMSLASSAAVEEDRKALTTILSRPPEQLCKDQHASGRQGASTRSPANFRKGASHGRSR